MPISDLHPVTNEDVMAYLDGELSPEAAAAMTTHLTQCRTCQDIAADLQGVSRQLAGWTIETAEFAEGLPVNIAQTLAERDAAKAKRPASAWHFVAGHRWALAAATIVLVPVLLITSVWFFSDGQGGSFRTKGSRQIEPASDAALVGVPPPPGASEPLMASNPVAVPQSLPEAKDSYAPPSKRETPGARQVNSEPLIVRTADLRLTARSFDSIRTDLDRILAQFGGHIAQLSAASPTGEARSLNATLRIPSPQLEAALGELRKLGRVDSESQRGEEVTQQSIDLDARLKNARHTEERLTEILRIRTGKLSDVLEVEEKLAQVRGEIEQAEAEQKGLNNRIAFATVSLQVSEDYRAPLVRVAPPSTGTRLGNAAVEGMHSAVDGFITLVQLLLAITPSLLLWTLVLGLPAYFLWKKLRHR